MVRPRRLLLTLLTGLLVFLSGDGRHPSRSARPQPLQTFARSPVRFEPTEGGGFVASARDRELLLDADGAHYLRPGAAPVTMRVAGGQRVAPVASDRLPTRVNRFVGSDPARWRRDLPTYGRVTFPAVRAGVDLVFHGEHGQLEYDFIVAPGADAGEVVLEVEGADVERSADGALKMGAGAGTVTHERPRVYQRDALGREHDVAASFRLVGPRHVGFTIAAYDRDRPLVIDPVAGYSTFFGGADGESAAAVALDEQGNVYVTGGTSDWTSLLVPPHTVLAPASPNVAFVAKMDGDGTLVWLTVFGGTGMTSAQALVVDGAHQPLVLANVQGPDLPTTPDAAQRSLATLNGFAQSLFLLQLAEDGASLTHATYLDIATNDHALPACAPGHECFTRFHYRHQAGGLALDGSTIFVGGRLDNQDMDDIDQPIGSAPTFLQPGTADTSMPGGFVVAIDGGHVTARRFLGAATAPTRLAVADGKVFAATHACPPGPMSVLVIKPGSYQDAPAGDCEGYLARFDRSLATLEYGTWFGSDGTEAIYNVVATSAAEVYLVGSTGSARFPTTEGDPTNFMDGYVARFDTTKTGPSSLVYTRLLGGDGADFVYGLTRSPDGHLFLAGTSGSTDFPFPRPISLAGFHLAAYVRELGPDGATLATEVFDGRSSHDVAIAIAYGPGGPVVVGFSNPFFGPDDFPNTMNLQPGRGGLTDAFIARVPDGTELPDGGPGTSSLVVTPASASVPPGGHVAFVASKGTPPYAFALSSNASGATLDGAGAYLAGRTGSVTDFVRVTDGTGRSVTAIVDVGSGVSIDPKDAVVPVGQLRAFTATGGAGAPYVWTASAGSIGADGVLHAPETSGIVLVTATDTLGNVASVSVRIADGDAPPPPASTDPPPSTPAPGPSSTPGTSTSSGASVVPGSPAAPSPAEPTTEDGCSCRTGRGPTPPLAPLIALAPLVLAVRRRRTAPRARGPVARAEREDVGP